MALCGAPQGGALGDTCSKHLVACALSQIVTSASTDLQDYTYYFVPAPWLSVKLLRLLQCYPPPGNGRATQTPGRGPPPPRRGPASAATIRSPSLAPEGSVNPAVTLPGTWASPVAVDGSRFRRSSARPLLSWSRSGRFPISPLT